MNPTETSSANMNNESGNKENSLNVGPKTMAINVQESQPTPEVEKKPGKAGRAYISFGDCILN